MRNTSPLSLHERDYELMLQMRDKIGRLEERIRRFYELDDIKKLAREEAVKLMRETGFDMEHINETNSQVQFLMGIKRGFKGFVYAVLAATLSVVGTLAATYLSGKVFK